MESTRFDHLTRVLVRYPTRRGVLAGLSAMLVGRGPGTATAAACPPEQVAAAGGRCVCWTTGRPPANGICPCPLGQARCAGACRSASSYQTDFRHCGACTVQCDDYQTCRGGTCVNVCPDDACGPDCPYCLITINRTAICVRNDESFCLRPCLSAADCNAGEECAVAYDQRPLAYPCQGPAGYGYCTTFDLCS